jgi:hypothetical protein
MADNTNAERQRRYMARRLAKTGVTDTGAIAALTKERDAALAERDAALADLAQLRRMYDNGHLAIVQSKLILASKAFVPAEVFKTLIIATHEDRAGPRWKTPFREAQVFLVQHERMLVKKPPPPAPAGFPSTVEEMMAAKYRATEQRRASARKAAATRAANKAAKNRKALARH